jgi:hypothetical protein
MFSYIIGGVVLTAVLRIQIHRIHAFLGLLDLDPFNINPHQNDQGRKGPCFFQRLIALKCLKGTVQRELRWVNYWY